MEEKPAMKGRARICIPAEIMPDGVQHPKAGEIIYDAMECKDLFDKWHDFLILSDEYTIIGVFFEPAWRRQWIIVVESDTIPLPKRDEMIPELIGTYFQMPDGKVGLLDLKIM